MENLSKTLCCWNDTRTSVVEEVHSGWTEDDDDDDGATRPCYFLE